MLDVPFHPNRDLDRPLYRQLADHIETLIRRSRLRSGEKLPASRELASTLGLSRNTVNQAYQALLDEGLVYAHVGMGTFVADIETSTSEATSNTAAFVWEGLFARRASSLLGPPRAIGARSNEVVHDFLPGGVDPASLPDRDLKRCYRLALDEDHESLSHITFPFGWPRLRRAIAATLIGRGIECHENDVLIVSGAQQALSLIARLLVEPGDRVAVEEPGYFGAISALRASQAELIGIQVDQHGLRTDQLQRVAHRHRLKLVYTTPAVQSPTGVAMSNDRRIELLELTERHQIPIIDDDYDGELRIDTPAVAALKNLDRTGHVIYLGTFSKAVFPTLRLGYVVAPQTVLRKLAALKVSTDFGSSLLAQAALARFLESGALERHVRKVRKLYSRRIDLLIKALEHAMPEDASFSQPAGGNSLWLTLPENTDLERLHQQLSRRGVRVGGGDAFFLEPPQQPSIFLSVARLHDEVMTSSVNALAEALWEALRQPDASQKQPLTQAAPGNSSISASSH
jgi:GntR family transcriptional regulator/MocR family aminotransferase